MILGPTAGGKSDLAVELAEQLAASDGQPGEVLSADSMQLYRYLDAGTAKPEPALRQRVPHHLIDIAEPTQPFTVYDWLSACEAVLAACAQRGARPIVVGGTNLYLKALLEGMMPGPGRDDAFRATLDPHPTHTLHAQLQHVDPHAAQRIHPNDRQRITRALEVQHLTGQPISQQQLQWADTPGTTYRYEPQILGLHWPTDAINPRINARVKRMFQPADPNTESLPDEVKRLDALRMLGPQAREALGYKQVLAVLHPQDPTLADDKLRTMDDAMERTKVLTRRFAKQQRTWLKRFANVHWLPADQQPANQLAAQAIAMMMKRH